METLKKKTIHGIGWSFADNIVGTGISFFVGIVLARILSPNEFGIIGMVAIFMAISNTFIESGLSSALIRKVNVENIDYNTVFYSNFVLSLFFYFLLFSFAPSISVFFNEPQLILITRVMGCTLIINAFSIIQRTILIKKVDFKSQTKISFIASFLSGIIGIGMAIYGFGVWSLVWQQISRQFISVVFLWFYSHWRPVIEFSKQSFSELFGFGSKLLLSNLLGAIYNNIYFVVIGRFYSSSILGQYTRANQFSDFFSNTLTSVIQKVSYPVLSTLQADSKQLKTAYSKIIKSTMLITFGAMMGLAAIAKPLVLVLIGVKWFQSIYFMQIICFGGMLYPLHALNLNIIEVKGRSDLYLKLEIIKKSIGIIPIFIGIIYGIELMLWGGVVLSFISYFLNAYYSARLIDYSIVDQIKDIAPTFIISIFIALPMWALTFFMFENWILLILQCILGIILALIIYEISNLEEYIELKQIALSFIKRKQNR